MASGFFKRAMVYLGLVDDEYDDYDEYEPRASVGPAPAPTRVAGGRRRGRAPSAVATSTIRPMPREDSPTVTPR